MFVCVCVCMHVHMCMCEYIMKVPVTKACIQAVHKRQSAMHSSDNFIGKHWHIANANLEY